MYKHLAILIACLLAFSMAQNKTCGDSEVGYMESGLISLGVPTASFAQKQYIVTFNRDLGVYAEVYSAFAIAGFQGSCSQDYYSLVVDRVDFENRNTKMRVTMDYNYGINSTNYQSQWTKIKLTYLVVSSQFSSFSAPEGGNYVWAGSVDVSVNNSGVFGLYGSGSIFDNQIDASGTCGYLNQIANSNSPKFDRLCGVGDVILAHYYIMGFKFDPSVSTYKLAASTLINNYLNINQGNKATFGTGGAQGFGPLIEISQYAGALKRLKVGIVLTTIRSFSTYPNAVQAFSYSGIYMPIQLKNVQRPIIKGTSGQYNVQRYDIPKLTYQIYGLSSFTINKTNTCTSLDVNVDIKDLYTAIVQTDNTNDLNNVFISADFFTKNTNDLCSGSAAPSRQMIEITKKTVSTVPDLLDNHQDIEQIRNNPLTWELEGYQAEGASKLITYTVALQYENFVVGNAYKFTTEIEPDSVDPLWDGAFDNIDNPYVRYVIEIDGQIVHDQVLNSSTELEYGTEHVFGIAIQSTKPLVKFIVTAPRPVTSNRFQAHVSISIDQYTTIYNPKTDCCQNQCPSGSGINLQSTPPSCIVCNGTSLSFNSATGTCACKVGFYNILAENQNGGLVCFPCLGKLCSTCSANNVTQCNTCIVGADFDANKTCKCINGYYETNGACVACPAKCATCQVGGVCSTCANDPQRSLTQNCDCAVGYYDDGTAKCKACNPICKTCSSVSTCTSCFTENNRTLVNGQCVCASGFYQIINSDNTATCKKCNAECKQCSAPNVCLNCKSEDKRIIGYDEIGHQTCLCAPGHSALKDGTCVENGCTADPYCQSCDEARGVSVCIQCLTSTKRVLAIPQYACVCQEGFYENKGTCVPCPSGCAKCSNATVCERCAVSATNSTNGTCTCPQSYFFATEPIRYCKRCNDYCLSCKNSSSCDQCLPGYSATTDGQCICPRGKYINSNLQCVNCIGNCTVCESETNCTLCNTGFYVQDNKCVKRCNPGYFISGAVCEKCQDGCSHCEKAGTCLVCEAGRYSYNGVCYVNCPAGSIAQSQNQTCIACNSPCKTCVQHPSKCLSCSQGSFFEFGCHSTCPIGTFNNNGVCQYCSFECASCLGNANTCISCPDGQYLFSGKCYKTCPIALVNGKCPNLCPNGYYTQSNTNNCVKCNDKCATCKDSADKCTSCVSGVAHNGVCVQSCPSNTLNINGNCVACSQGCNGCTQSADKCLACQSGYFLSGNKCVASCPSDSYRDGTNGCKKCNSSCKTCSAANFCTSCIQSRSQPINGICYSCIYPCATCTDYEKCTTCLSGFNLFDGRCVSSCPRGSTAVNGVCTCTSGVFQNGICATNCASGYTNVNGACQACSTDCAECSVNVNTCTSCKSGFILNAVTGKCQVNTNCQFGEFFSSEEQRCKRICPVGTSFQDSMCLTECLEGYIDNRFGGCVQQGTVSGCSFPYFYQQGSCVSTCNAGSYPNSISRVCQACSSNCFSCMSSAFCTSCRSGFDLKDGICITGQRCSNNKLKYNGVCLDSCPAGTIVSNGYCARRCDPNVYWNDGKCYNECPANLPYRTDVACVAVCPAGYVLDGKVCKLTAQTCPSGQFYNSQTGLCTACSASCSECQYTSTYCTLCPAGTVLTSNRCVQSNSCGSGKFRTSTGQCSTCPAKCTQCVSSTECSTCANGYVFNGYDCVLRVSNLKQVQLTQSSILRRANTVFISIRLSIIPNGLSNQQKNNFFIVIPSSNDKIVKVNQWLSTTEANTVLVAIEYQTYPQLSTVFLALNAAILSSSYANVGYTATQNSFLSVVVSTSTASAPATLTVPTSSTNSIARSIQDVSFVNKALRSAIREKDIAL